MPHALNLSHLRATNSQHSNSTFDKEGGALYNQGNAAAHEAMERRPSEYGDDSGYCLPCNCVVYIYYIYATRMGRLAVFTYALHCGRHYFHGIQKTKAKVGDKRCRFVFFPCISSNRKVNSAFGLRAYGTALMDIFRMLGGWDMFKSCITNAPKR